MYIGSPVSLVSVVISPSYRKKGVCHTPLQKTNFPIVEAQDLRPQYGGLEHFSPESLGSPSSRPIIYPPVLPFQRNDARCLREYLPVHRDQD